MKKYLGLIGVLNSVCWFWFDFSWMQDWTTLAQIGSILAIGTGILLFCISRSWSSGALMNWIIMNSLWMHDMNFLATIFGVLGFIMIIIATLRI